MSYPSVNSCVDSLYVNPATPNEIKSVILDLKTKSSSGIDEIPSLVLKQIPDNMLVSLTNMLVSLTHVFNRSLATGKFISAFKKSKVVPTVYSRKVA